MNKYKDKRTAAIAAGERVKELDAFKKQIEKRLRYLETAETRQDLMRMNSNHFEALGGDREGQCSIRINQKWRLCFEWPEGTKEPYNIEIVDYH